MKYYLIAGEASGDLHASNLMKALRQEDPAAEFRYFGGDLMKDVGGVCVKHYKDLAYMGFIPVVMHLPVILKNMKVCREDIMDWKPDVLILIDYPGFNLEIASHIKQHTSIPVFYYISPKIWAWKEHRIKAIKKYVDKMFSILPFEIDFYNKHNYPINYVGNPCVDAVETFKSGNKEEFNDFISKNSLASKPIIALLAGSRRQEIKDNLPRMIEAAKPFAGRYQIVIAGAPSIEEEYYNNYIGDNKEIKLLFNNTYNILKFSTAALVTSGTATLETALFRVPQVVCYYTKFGKLFSFLKKHFLKVKYISLVNLIADKEVVKELVADKMTVGHINKELDSILNNQAYHDEMIAEYDRIIEKLGHKNASGKAAKAMIKDLKG